MSYQHDFIRSSSRYTMNGLPDPRFFEERAVDGRNVSQRSAFTFLIERIKKLFGNAIPKSAA